MNFLISGVHKFKTIKYLLIQEGKLSPKLRIEACICNLNGGLQASFGGEGPPNFNIPGYLHLHC